MKTELNMLACLVLFAGCSTQNNATAAKKSAPPARIDPMETVNLHDGVNKEEAEIMANDYFMKHGPGCGASTDAIDAGEYWEIPTSIGYAAVPGNPIRIQKTTGYIFWDQSMPNTRN